MAEWGFYGRDRDMARLRECLEPQGGGKFRSCYHVIGRRRVGKTALLEKTMEKVTDNRPWVAVTIGAGRHHVVESAEESLASLREAIDGADRKSGTDLMAGLPPPDPRYGANRAFVRTVRDLLHRDVVVTIDEFQRCSDNHILAGFPEMIDKLESGVGDPPRPGERWGTLIVMGSHQQRMLDIVGPDGPMYRRSRLAMNVRPWDVRTVLDVAAAHGALSRPARFLTLWTAFGGMPERWEGFVTDGNGAFVRDFLEHPDDTAWRQGFLERELERLDAEENRFDSGAWLSLAPGLRPLMARLGDRDYRGGLPFGVFFDSARRVATRGGAGFPKGEPTWDTVMRDMKRMRDHMDLVIDRPAFLDPDQDLEARRPWRLDDGIALFQARVFPELFGKTRRKRDGDYPTDTGTGTGATYGKRIHVDMDTALRRLETLEGEMLERLSAQLVESRPGVQWALHGATLRKDATPDDGLGGKDVEVDLVGVLDHLTERPVLLLGTCKRDPGAHRVGRAEFGFSKLVEAAASASDATRAAWNWPPGRGWPGTAPGAWRRHLAISPHFPPDGNRAHLEARGFACVGIRDMARMFGIDPGPCAEAEAEALPSGMERTVLAPADSAAEAFEIPDVNAGRRERLASLTARLQAHGASLPDRGPLPKAPDRADFESYYAFKDREGDWLDFMIGRVEDTLHDIGDFDYDTREPIRRFPGTTQAGLEADGTGRPEPP